MAKSQPPFLAAALLLVFFGLRGFSSSPACPEPCTCQRAQLLNCSSSSLSSVPQLSQDSFAELDLSNNHLGSATLRRPQYNLRSVWLGNNSITHLSLCVEGNLKGRYFRQRLRTRSRRGCLTWAPALQLLSVERNLLEQLPEGLDGVESLQILQLSFNKISTLQPQELSHLRQLKELHLKQNLITHLHPQMLQDLVQLRVLDLSFNMLTSLHPSAYLTLRSIGTDLRLNGNRWKCDCNMRSLRRRMAYDHSRGLQTWSMVCASPSILSGRDLLQLEEEDLKCLSAEKSLDLHQDVTVYSGSEILLSCSAEDSLWWTSGGQASESQPNTDLLISDISERNTGLYVCVSEEQHIVSIFNLQISKLKSARNGRSLPRTRRQITSQDSSDRLAEEKNQRATSSDLALAVSLSVIFTFLIAFILGVLARPCIDGLWKRVTKKKTSSTTNSVSSVEQRQYDNEAFSSAEEPEDTINYRERRVTFSTVDIIEDRNINYYDTVASGERDSIKSDSENEYEPVMAKKDKHSAGDSGSENVLRQSNPEDVQSDDSDSSDGATRRRRDMEFENIPDPTEMEERSLSSCSDSSSSEKVLKDTKMSKGDQSITELPQLAEDSVQQRSDFSTAGNIVLLSHISSESKSEIPGFSSEPFENWSPHTNNRNPKSLNTSQDNEELFEFSDSTQSISPRSSSVISPFDNAKQIGAHTLDKQKRGDVSSSSSYISDDEPTQYTVNSDGETEQSERLQYQNIDTVKPTVIINQVRDPSFSGSDSEEEITELKVRHNTDPDGRWPVVNLQHIPHIKRRLDIKAPSPTADSSSSTDSEDETKGYIKKREQKELHVSRVPVQGTQAVSRDPESQWPTVDLRQTMGIKRRIDIKAPSPTSDSSAGSDGEYETISHIGGQRPGRLDIGRLPFQESKRERYDPDGRWPVVNRQQIPHIKRRLDIKAPSPTSDSSAGSDGEYETISHIGGQRPGRLDIGRLPFQESKRERYDPDGRWPVVNLQHIPHIKRRLDIKAPSPTADSSSSTDSEDETKGYIKKREQKELHVSRVPVQGTQAVSRDPESQWPTVDLRQTMGIKRRLDIKAPSPTSDSSAGSDGEYETISHIGGQRPGRLDIGRLPFQESKRERYDPDGRWPIVNLQHIPHIKRRLDIKAPSPTADSSASTDSEDETKGYIKKREQKELHVSRVPVQGTQAVSRDPESQWPTVDLRQTMGIKRRLDIKAPSPTSDSSAGSDGEYETISHIGGQRPGKLDIGRLPFQESKRERYDPDGRWPVVNLQHIPHIKRRLDIKAPSPTADSSASTDSEDETKGYIKKQEQKELHVSRVPVQGTQAVSRDPESQWPTVDLRQTMGIKRRLDIKAPSPTSDSSAGSDGEYETISHIGGHRPGKLDIGRLPFQESKRERYDPDGRWPVVNLQHIPHIKRRLDIKAPSPTADSSASTDSEDETNGYIKKQEQKELHVSRVPVQGTQAVSRDPESQWPAVDLRQTMGIKRRLDIKAPSPTSDSSAGSDGDYETISHIGGQRPGRLDIGRLPFQESKRERYDPDGRWPIVNLQHIPHIKRRLDIKAPSPTADSSASTDSEDETKGYIKKREQKELHVSRVPVQGTQAVSRDPESQWPTVDLRQTMGIKRRLDIKAPSPTSDSSAGSDGEYETISHIGGQRPGKLDIGRLPFQESKRERYDPDGRWPVVNLQHIPHIKRRLDIKAPSPTADSSASTDSEDETKGYIEKQEQKELHVSRVPVQGTQAVSRDPKSQWPAVDLRQTIGIKRRLDIKAPSPTSDSSAGSDGEYETTSYIGGQRPGKLDIGRLPFQESKRERYDPDGRWPIVNLQHIPHIKRRLDIKAPSPTSDSSAGSDGEYETTSYIGGQRPGKLDIGQFPFQESKREPYDPDGRWPIVNLQHIPHINRRLDIKAPSPTSDSFSSTDSEDETNGYIKKQEQKELHVSRVPVQGTQAVSRDPESHWPTVDLQQSMGIKRRLDIKAPSPTSDSSAGSDGEYETTSYIGGQRPGKLDIGQFPFQESKRERYDPDGRWPIVNLQHIPHIKRRLDIKAPSPTSDSFSSTDSEDETNGYIKKQEQKELHVSRVPVQGTQAVSRDPESQWPSVDLRQTMGIKRRLDIKAPSPTSDSSAGSDGEYETISHIGGQRPGKLDIGRLPFQESKRERYDPDGRWPVVNLQHIPHIKRRLDIKAPSPTADSYASTDSEDETKGYIEKQEQKELHVSQVPVQGTQAVSRDPKSQWPAVDLRQTIGIKRRLDIKAPSPTSDSSAGSDGEYETTSYIGGQRPGKLDIGQFPFQESKRERYDPDGRWPIVNLQHIPHIKRRLDIKAPSPTADSSGSTDSEDETNGYIKKQEQKELHVSRVPVQGTQAVSRDPESHWPTVDLQQSMGIKRRLDIKAPSPTFDSSAGSDGEYETISHMGGQRPGKLDIGRLPFQESKRERYDPDGRWPVVNLQHIPHIKRRLDIKAPSPTADSSASTDSEDETKGYIEKQEQKELHVSRVPVQGTQAVSRNPKSQWPAVDLWQTKGFKRRLDIKAPSPNSDSSASTDGKIDTTNHIAGQQPGKLDIGQTNNINATVNQWPAVNLGNITKIKRRLDIKTSTPSWDSAFSVGNTSYRLEEKTAKVYNSTHRYSSSSSDYQEEGLKDYSKHHLTSEPDPNPSPELGLSSNIHIKRRLDIKAQSHSLKSSSSSDESDSGTTDITETMKGIQRGKIPHIKNRLDIKVPSQQPDMQLSKLPLDSHQSESHSSRSESEGENRGHKEKAGMGISTTSEKKFIRSPRAPMISVSHNPKKDPNIKLEKYGTISDESENKLTDDTVYTTEINPELQSRWATMNLGISRFRQRLEITSHTNEQPNVSQPPSTDSLHSLSTESRPGRIRLKRRVAGMQEIIQTDYSPVLENNPVNVFTTIKNPNDKSNTSAEFTQKEAENYSLLTSKNESKSETVLVDFGDSQMTKYPDFSEKAPSKPSQQPLYSSSRSISEDKTIDQYVLDLSLGVPRIKQRLNFKAPSPEPSSSSSCDSENENSLTGYQAKQSTLTTNVLEVADDSPILYKRSIIKTSSIPSYSFTPSDRSKTVDRTQEGVGDRDASLPSISFDTIVRRGIKQRHEIKQTDVGHHLPDLPISKATSVNVLTSLQQAPSAEPRSASRDSSSSVSFEIMQDHEKSATLLHKYSSLTSKSVTPSASDIYDKLGSSPGRTFETSTVVSEDKSERRGLSALKDKSLEMRKWDSDLDKDAAPLFDDQHPQGGTQVDDSSYTADTEVLSEQQLPNANLDSASANEKRILNLLYGIPQYRRHDFGHPKPPQ